MPLPTSCSGSPGKAKRSPRVRRCCFARAPPDFGRTRSQDPVSVLVNPDRKVLHRFHVTPADERLPCFGDVDHPSGTLIAAFQTLTIIQQITGGICSLCLVKAARNAIPVITGNLSVICISGNLRAQDGGPKALLSSYPDLLQVPARAIPRNPDGLHPSCLKDYCRRRGAP
jgi:hypothetical protein